MVTVRDDFVEFIFFRPGAGEVCLAGDFNNWRIGELPMIRTDDGHWVAQIRLPAGEFKFRYYADGQWFTDYAAFGVEPGQFGHDSVVRVLARPLKVAPPGTIREIRRTAAA